MNPRIGNPLEDVSDDITHRRQNIQIGLAAAGVFAAWVALAIVIWKEFGKK